MRQGIIKRLGLDRRELAEIRVLADIVEMHDTITLKLNWEMLRQRPPHMVNDFLCYADGKLVAFLGIYILTTSESELSGMVHPDYRRQGIMTKMVNEALELLRGRGTKSVVYICPRASQSGAAILKSRGVPYSFSEYVMERKESGEVQLPDGLKADIRLREARIPDDVPLMAELNQVGFNLPPDDAEEFAKSATGSSEITYIIESEGRSVGKVSVQMDGNTAFIFGVCVRPEARGQGIGRAALAGTINRVQRERSYRHFLLEVAVLNEGALGLYESLGFHRTNVMDYYKTKEPAG